MGIMKCKRTITTKGIKPSQETHDMSIQSGPYKLGLWCIWNTYKSVHGWFQNLQGHNGLNHYLRPVTFSMVPSKNYSDVSMMHWYIHPFWRQISRERSYLKVNIMKMLAALPFLLNNNITPWVWDGTVVMVMGKDALNCPNGQANTHPGLLMIQESWESYHSPLNLRQGLTPSGHVCNMKSSVRYIKLQGEMEKLTVTGILKSWNPKI